MENNSLKYTCLFGGGAIRGTAHVGVVKALEELEIDYDTVAGSSVGAIVAALLAVGYTASELHDIFLQANFELFKDIYFNLGQGFAISKGEVFLEWVRELIEKKYYKDTYQKGKNSPVTFSMASKNLVIITTNLSNFSCKEFSKVNTPDFEIATAVRISSSMPGLMKPYEIDNSILVDGDLQKSWPMWELSSTLKNSKNRLLEIRLEGDCCNKDMNAIDYANTVYSCITSIATNFVLDRYANNDKFDFIVINTGNIVIIDFNQPREKREYLMDIGYRQTLKYFKKTLPQKKECLFEIYDKLYSMFLKIQHAIFVGNIKNAKIIIGELFILLSESYKYIEQSDIKLIKEYKSCFYNNIKYPALFGITRLKSSKEILAKTHDILSHLKNKMIEFKNYNKIINNNNIDN